MSYLASASQAISWDFQPFGAGQGTPHDSRVAFVHPPDALLPASIFAAVMFPFGLGTGLGAQLGATYGAGADSGFSGLGVQVLSLFR